MKKRIKSMLAIVMAFVMMASMAGFAPIQAEAAKKTAKKVNKVEITKPSTTVLVLAKGKTYTIKSKVTPSNAKNKKVMYTSSKKKVATVSSKGKIKALKKGTTKITVKSVSSPKKKDTITVKVGTPIKKVTVDQKKVTLEEGKTTTLKATISPKKATYKKVSYVSSDKNVAIVSSKGVITAKAAGIAKITVMAKDGSNKKATCTVTVTAKQAGEKDNTTQGTKPGTTPDSGNGSGAIPGSGNNSGTTPDHGNGSETTPDDDKDPEETPDDSEYTLLFSDNFDGTQLNMDNWNYEPHARGWVNNELQEYTTSTDNVFVEDGKLVLKAIKDEVKSAQTEDGKPYYTSGKVTTQNKVDFKYGKIEASVKVPSGQGLWPAFWMMPTDESFYGQWPRCGEIDIMEVLGHEPNKAYGTIHYGAGTGELHREQQGTYVLEEGTFADDYHVFSVEWEPSEMRFYVDGNLYHTVNDWYTKQQGLDEIAFPAPFDQTFYVQFNLAVGGDWPGDPAADINTAEYYIDYVKVYQKESYDENVTRPATVLRDPDTTGNYVVNGDFAIAEELADDTDWSMKYANGGAGEATIADNQLTITPSADAEVDYAVQLVQPNIPMKQGGVYKLTFDAYASADRTMIVDVSAPDNGWIRYLADTKLDLTTTKQSYELEFTVTDSSDPNGRLEFNLGNQGSLAEVYLSNVRIEKLDEVDVTPQKGVLPDGNYVYNGAFDMGDDRMKYWETDIAEGAGEVSVTNINNVRELKVTANTDTAAEDVVVLQSDLAIPAETELLLAFEAYADTAKTVKVTIDGQTFDIPLTETKQMFKFPFTTGTEITDDTLKFYLGGEGTSYIDNVRVGENAMVINGYFSNGLNGWTPYTQSGSAEGSCAVDEMNEENKPAAFTINKTGTEDWHVQLKQGNVVLENGKYYKLTFKAKTDLEGGRQIRPMFQKNGGDYAVYGGSYVTLGSEYEEYTVSFQMQSETDTATSLIFAMGKVDREINTSHIVCIDDVVLVETDSLEEPDQEEPEVEGIAGNLIKNPTFEQVNGDVTDWLEDSITAPGAATYSVSDNAITYNITNVGTADWNVQLKQTGLTMIEGHTYQLKVDLLSDVDRTINIALLDPNNNYAYYGGDLVTVTKDEVKNFEKEITVDKATCQGIDFVISLGKITDVDTPAGTVTISNISLIDLDVNQDGETGGEGDEGNGEDNEGETTPNLPEVGTNLLKNPTFVQVDGDVTDWEEYSITAPGAATLSVSDNSITYDITNVGTADWNVQLKQSNLTLVQGHRYRLTVNVLSNVDRKVNVVLMDPQNEYLGYGGEMMDLQAGVEKTLDQIIEVTDKPTSSTLDFTVSMGQITDVDTPAGTVTISNVSIKYLGPITN